MLQQANVSVGPCFSDGPVTAAGGTAFARLIPPYRGVASPLLYGLTKGTSAQPNWVGKSATWTQISTLVYTTGATAHLVGIMRPLNFCYLTADAAASQAVVVIDANPGSYSTAYKYPTPGAAVPRTSNNLMAASDYVAYQAADGTWVLTTVSSISSLSVTLASNVPTGGLVAGQPLFFFGVIGDTDPATALTQPQITVPANQTQKTYQDLVSGLWQSLHLGDPLLFYSPNTTNAGTMDLVSAFYAKAA